MDTVTSPASRIESPFEPEPLAVAEDNPSNSGVTGAGLGIGRGIPLALARAGTNVVLAAPTATDLTAIVEDVERQTSASVVAVPTKVTEHASCNALAAATIEAFGAIDIVCANGGIFPEALLYVMSTEALSQALDVNVNVKGCVFTIQACLDDMKRSECARIILASSTTGPWSVDRSPWLVDYGASHAAQLGFMHSAAIELASHCITVNAVLPDNIPAGPPMVPLGGLDSSSSPPIRSSRRVRLLRCEPTTRTGSCPRPRRRHNGGDASRSFAMGRIRQVRPATRWPAIGTPCPRPHDDCCRTADPVHRQRTAESVRSTTTSCNHYFSKSDGKRTTPNLGVGVPGAELFDPSLRSTDLFRVVAGELLGPCLVGLR